MMEEIPFILDTTMPPEVMENLAQLDGITTLQADPGRIAMLNPVVFDFAPCAETDNKRIAMLHWPLRGPQETVDLALSDIPVLVTRVVWQEMALEARLAGFEAGAVRGDNIVSTDMTEVLPEAALKWLAAWQHLINTGAVWHADGDVGQFAMEALIERGYCLLGQRRIRGFYAPVPSRHDRPSGSPGTVKWVELMMGPEYAQWIKQIPE